VQIDPSKANVTWEVVIGLEVHAQLLTQSKMFCGCPSTYVQGEPNTQVCPVCLGMPGILPVLNSRAIEFAVMTGLALNCTIARRTQFDRKNYPYPDLVKGYQISQYENPVATGGWLDLEVDGTKRRIGITRVHLEEDVAKLQHVRVPSGDSYSLVDMNRSGVPLMEMVSEPDMRCAEEARQYLIAVRSILQYLGVSSADMEKGALRCDANVSIRPRGSTDLTSKVEVKNMNSLRSVFMALEYEISRQTSLLERGERVEQETRGWVENTRMTVSQRTKEQAHDYRYFPEPDLPPLFISEAWIGKILASLPELPRVRKDRYVSSHGLSDYDASLITASKITADFFEETLDALGQIRESVQFVDAKIVANWLSGEMARLLNVSGTEILDAKITPAGLASLIQIVESGIIGSTQSRTVFQEMFENGGSPMEIVNTRGLAQIADPGSIIPIVDQVIDLNPDAVQDYVNGKQEAIRYLVGQAMKVTKGRANPAVVLDLLQTRISDRD
jgi:aspartyl-tRNA(Asn)/glutamyl-tRNA(Gln) amidotransferase subunit B